jgi:hypothetical protein
MLALFGGLALALLAQPAMARAWRVLAGACVFAAGLLAAPPIVAALLLALGSVLVAPIERLNVRALRPGPALPAALALLLGFGALALRGVGSFGAATAGAAMDSFVFLFALLAAAATLIPDEPHDGGVAFTRIVWLYPLLRLYVLGPWNDGWSLATVLLGASGATWAALAALTQASVRARASAARRCFLGLLLAVIGLGTSAGVAAACYLALTYVLLCAVALPRGVPQERAPGPALWALSGALPFTAPFVAIWMSTSAAAAAGVTALAGVCWGVALLYAVHTMFDGPYLAGDLTIIGLASAILGIGAPLVALGLIQPVVEQLQAGLTAYGVLAIWPWVGVGATDSGNRVATSFPTVAVAALMLVLAALVFLLAHWRRLADPPAAAGRPATPPGNSVLDLIRDEVPWLGGGRERVPGRSDDAR